VAVVSARLLHVRIMTSAGVEENMRCIASLLAGSVLSAACGGRSSLDTFAASAGDAGSVGVVTTAGGARQTGGSKATGGTTTTRLVAKAIAAGSVHTCAVLSNGTIRCWGDNGSSQLGNNGNGPNSLWPVTVSGITDAVDVKAGGWHTCALLNSGEVRCWGGNSYGQLGDGSTNLSAMSVAVVGLTSAVAVAAGFWHTCALVSGGGVQCWGYNDFGQLGNDMSSGTSPISMLRPIAVVGIASAASITAGDYHSCAALHSGVVQCWGGNIYGELGDGTATSSQLPVTVSGITNANGIAAGYWHTCGVLSNGTIHCWGNNGSGELGNGTLLGSLFPVLVSGITNAVAVAAGWSETCAVLSGGAIQCWGNNDAMGTSSLPVAVSGITDAIAVTTSGGHTCALLNGGSVRCWGSNLNGELGNGTTTDSSVPVTVTGF
jgi:alpha-tubulin suppressor-like RCC1 family protein